MQPDFFIVVSLSRCGSTTVHRALNCHTGINCILEPEITLPDMSANSIGERMDALRAQWSGMKHVWDPSGYPFLADHVSRVADLDRHAERWVKLNEIVL